MKFLIGGIEWNPDFDLFIIRDSESKLEEEKNKIIKDAKGEARLHQEAGAVRALLLRNQNRDIFKSFEPKKLELSKLLKEFSLGYSLDNMLLVFYCILVRQGVQDQYARHIRARRKAAKAAKDDPDLQKWILDTLPSIRKVSSDFPGRGKDFHLKDIVKKLDKFLEEGKIIHGPGNTNKRKHFCGRLLRLAGLVPNKPPEAYIYNRPVKNEDEYYLVQWVKPLLK